MTPRKVFLDELTTTSQNFKVKAEVISKDRPQTAHEKELRYQSILLLDEKGNKMRGALFGNQLRTYRDAIVYNGTYEISNPTIKPMEDRYKRDPSELNYQMGFNPQTLIQQMDTEESPALPEYRALGQIPKAGEASDRYDLIGIVMYVEEKPRKADLPGGRQINVAEIVLMDHSTQQPISVSAWGDLADGAFEALASKTANFKIVGLTALKVSQHKGFSMSTTMSSDIIQQPTGERAVALENWCKTNTQKLIRLRNRILQTRIVSSEKVIITIEALQAKRATNTLQDDRFWLRVSVPAADFSKLHAQLGCSKCGKYSNQPAEATYSCVSCSRDNCVSVPRVIFSCNVSDDTGNLSITAYADNVEKLFRLPAPDIFKIKRSEDLNAFEAARSLMARTSYLLQVGPKASLSLSNVLEWTVKQILLEPAADSDEPETNENKLATDTKTTDNQNLEAQDDTISDVDVPATIESASLNATAAYAGVSGKHHA